MRRPWYSDDPSAARRVPADDADPLEWLLFEQERVLTRSQALAHFTPDAVRHRLECGRWRRVHCGVYLADSGQLSRPQQLWTAVLANGPAASLAGPAAAVEGGLKREFDATIDVIVPAGRRRQQPGRSVVASSPDLPRIVVHRTDVLPARDVHARARPPRTVPSRSIVDAAQWAASDDAARAIVAAACRQRLVLPLELVEVLDRMLRARRRAVILETIGFTVNGAEALSEINLIKLCRRAGLPLPDQQVRRRDASGRERFLDGRWRAYRVVAEVDGGWHSEPEAWWADMWRQNDLWIDGEIIVRFPAWALRRDADRVAEQLRRALIQGGWRP